MHIFMLSLKIVAAAQTLCACYIFIYFTKSVQSLAYIIIIIIYTSRFNENVLIHDMVLEYIIIIVGNTMAKI